MLTPLMTRQPKVQYKAKALAVMVRSYFIRRMKPSIRHGFTLTEIAIVLGIVGLVLAAIWTAYGMVVLNFRTNQINKEINYILSKTTTVFSGSDFPNSAACSSYTAADGSTGYYGNSKTDSSYIAAVMNVVPPDMFTDTTNFTPLKNPWNNPRDAVGGAAHNFTLTFVSTAGCSSGTGTSTVGLDHNLLIDTGNMPSAACVRMLKMNKDVILKNNPIQICWNYCSAGIWVKGDPTPYTDDAITTNCKLSNPVSVSLSFEMP
jgi:prepilin-type N-terminal cleavage/methylation domain-containing protein